MTLAQRASAWTDTKNPLVTGLYVLFLGLILNKSPDLDSKRSVFVCLVWFFPKDLGYEQLGISLLY